MQWILRRLFYVPLGHKITPFNMPHATIEQITFLPDSAMLLWKKGTFSLIALDFCDSVSFG